jgi:ADP-L-glycero-D-manno-heptose 6-epimerase
MIIITGGSGFIGSAFAWKCNSEGVDDLWIVDHLKTSEKWQNLLGLRIGDFSHKDAFIRWIDEEKISPKKIRAIVHMGACSSTTEKDGDYLMENNFRFSQILAKWAVAHGIRFVYASSAATYGNGANGFVDDENAIEKLRPMNRYGYSKQLFDIWLKKNKMLQMTAGLKFFNVFGPNEYHKGEMRSVIGKSYEIVKKTGRMSLFRSYKKEYADGAQMRDFVYVKDCVEIMWWLMNQPDVGGLFNVGTGRARTWNDVAKALFSAMGLKTAVDYIDMPEPIRGHYQYFTEANTDKLKARGWGGSFRSLEESVADYVQNYLAKQAFLD